MDKYKIQNSWITILITINLFYGCSPITSNSTPVQVIMPEFSKDSQSKIQATPVVQNENFRAIHMGGNWGTNLNGGVQELPSDYFEWLHELNVNWVGVMVSVFVKDSMDSTVEREYSRRIAGGIPTFTDEELVNLIQALHQNGFKVYITLAIEDKKSSKAARPVSRWQMGDPDYYNEDPNVKPQNWPWALDHPDHDRFVKDFWKTYIEQAVHFGQIAEKEGVEMYSLGTETDRLFRIEPGWVGSVTFENEINELIQSVRKVYTGKITYAAYADTLLYSESLGAKNFWEETEFDVIGIDAYFPLVDAEPTEVMSVQDFENKWKFIFKKYLIPLKTRNPDKPILFTEFGYTDSYVSAYYPFAEEFERRIFTDQNENGLDDGQEVQSNIYEALFNVMDLYPGVLNGTFLWNNMMASDDTWNRFFGRARGFDIRGKPSEDVVRERYAEWAVDNK